MVFEFREIPIPDKFKVVLLKIVSMNYFVCKKNLEKQRLWDEMGQVCLETNEPFEVV